MYNQTKSQSLSRTRKLVFTALIAAIYASLTIILAPFSYGQLQVRIAEALTILPFFSSFSILGLTIGCAISNIFGGYGIVDILLGSLATLIGTFITYKIGKSNLKYKKLLAPLPAVISNAIIIPIDINFPSVVEFFKALFSNGTLPIIAPTLIISALWIGFGEFLACYIFGLPLLYVFDKNDNLKKYLNL